MNQTGTVKAIERSKDAIIAVYAREWSQARAVCVCVEEAARWRKGRSSPAIARDCLNDLNRHDVYLPDFQSPSSLPLLSSFYRLYLERRLLGGIMA